MTGISMFISWGERFDHLSRDGRPSTFRGPCLSLAADPSRLEADQGRSVVAVRVLVTWDLELIRGTAFRTNNRQTSTTIDARPTAGSTPERFGKEPLPS